MANNPFFPKIASVATTLPPTSTSLDTITASIPAASGTTLIKAFGDDTFSLQINSVANGVIILQSDKRFIAFGQSMNFNGTIWQAPTNINQVDNGSTSIALGTCYGTNLIAVQGVMTLYRQYGGSMYSVGWSRISGDGGIVITITKLSKP